ncbi:hypothetical protein SAY87_021731 [Trapa incisa]|uniref:Pentatricopeptide repeat-containing protein n=1 Tax=Trapa incisa TaxID=236973 RepID=A0AAN7JXI2_9MYRT|nr:hypothetical protein SAY87_021731 [Trapa incisa]
MSLFKKCSTMRDLKQAHARIITRGLEQSQFHGGKLVGFCAVSDGGDMDYAVSIFRRFRKPDGFLWNTMIRGFTRSGNQAGAFEYYKEMQSSGFSPDNFTFSFLMKLCGKSMLVLAGEQLHCSALKSGLDSHLFVRNTIMHMYGMFGEIDTARQLFDEMPEPSLVSWNTILDCYVCCNKFEEALNLFSVMFVSGIEPDEATLVVIVSACSELGALSFGRSIHDSIRHGNLTSIISVSNAFINMYSKCGAVKEALATFHDMKVRNTLTWNTIILGLAKHGYADEAMRLFTRMLKERLQRPDGITFLGVLCACSHCGRVEEGMEYFEIMREKFMIQPTIKHYGCMVDMMGRAGLVDEAYRLIQTMSIECNAIVWRALLGACHLHGRVEFGNEVMKHLQALEPGHSGDYVLLSSLYAGLGKWNEALEVRRLMHGRRVEKLKPGNSSIGLDPKSENTEVIVPADHTVSTPQISFDVEGCTAIGG